MPQVPDGPLVTTEWLEAHLEQPRVRVLDVRGRHPSSSLPHAKRAEYARSHLPGATFVDWGARLRRRRRLGPGAARRPRRVRRPRGRAGHRRRRPRRHLRRLLRHLCRPRGLGVPRLRRSGPRARRRLDDLERRGPPGDRGGARPPGDGLSRAAASAAAPHPGRGRRGLPSRGHAGGRAAAPHCSWASPAPRAPAISPAPAASRTRSWSTARPAYGPTRPRWRG